MPAVLIFIHVIVHAAIRREEGADRDEDTMTAGDVMRAVRIYHALRDHDPSLPQPPGGRRLAGRALTRARLQRAA